jgi:hypothetical protein
MLVQSCQASLCQTGHPWRDFADPHVEGGKQDLVGSCR